MMGVKFGSDGFPLIPGELWHKLYQQMNTHTFKNNGIIQNTSYLHIFTIFCAMNGICLTVKGNLIKVHIMSGTVEDSISGIHDLMDSVIGYVIKQ